MRKTMKRFVAVALAVAMCVPTTAFAAQTPSDKTEGSITTTFGPYAPALTVSVPISMGVKVNPLASGSGTSLTDAYVASKSIDIINGSIDFEEDRVVPVTATIEATITNKAEDVSTQYNTFTADTLSTEKKVYLQLSEAGTSAILELASGASATINNGKLDLSKYTVTGEAAYTIGGGLNNATITKYGSQLSVDIAGPTVSGSATSVKDLNAEDFTPTAGSFAVTGIANANAGWKDKDVELTVTYKIEASNPRNKKTPAISTAPNVTLGSDLTISLTGIGTTKVIAMALHNDDVIDGYADYLFTDEQWTVTYPSDGNATITVDKDDATLKFLTDDDNYNNKPQDLIIALSDGRKIVSTLTVKKS